MTTEQFTEMIPALRPRLLYAARQITGNDDDALDVVQDVLLRLWQRHESLHSDMSSLAVVATRNAALNLVRRRKYHESNADESLESLESGSSADSDIMLNEQVRILEEAIGRLRPSWQRIIRCVQAEQLTTAQLAAILGMSEASARSTLSAARRQLLALLEDKV